MGNRSVREQPGVLHQIGMNIRRHRKARHWTQERLAEETGLSTYFIGSVERGQAALSLRSLDRIARALHLPLAVLVQLDEEEDRRRLLDELQRRARKLPLDDLKVLHALLIRL
jgi:transcriptional regulator with XRE-family HTH domain